MQELEKILEEIENTFKENIENIEDENGVHHFVIDSFTATFLAKEIIRKHMNDVPEKEDAEICLSKEDFEFLRNHESMTFRCGNEYVTLHKGRSDGEKEMQRDNDSWIPVEERLPDENGIYLATCDDAEVPVKQMRYEKDVKPNGLFYDVYGIYDGKVYAWRPLPDLYRSEKGAEIETKQNGARKED